MDHDVKESIKSEALASNMYHHQWILEGYKNKALDTLYDFEPELEDDIKISMNHQKTVEDNLGAWVIPGEKK